MAKYRGTSKLSSKITPEIPFRADLSQAYADVDEFIKKVGKDQVLSIDADLSAAEGRVKRFLKTKDSSMDLDIGVNKKLLKETLADVQTLIKGAAGALSLGDSDKHKQLRETLASFADEFGSLSAVVNGKTISGLSTIIESVKDLESISGLSFEHIASKEAVRNSEHILENTKKTYQEVKKMQDKSDPFKIIKQINRRANNDDMTVDNLSRLQTRKGKLLNDKETLSKFVETDNHQLRIACEEAQKIVDQALENVEIRIANIQEAANTGTKAMSDFWDLFKKVSKNYSAEDFGKAYAYLAEAVSGTNPTMSYADAYKELEKKEKAHQKKLEADNKKREAIANEMQAMMANTPSLQAEYADNQRFSEEYVRALSQVSEGSLTAADAIEKMRAALGNAQTQMRIAVVDADELEKIKKEKSALEDKLETLQEIASVESQINLQKSNEENHQKRIDELKLFIKNQKDWIKYLGEALDLDNFKTSGKRDATNALRQRTAQYANYHQNPNAFAGDQYAKEMVDVKWQHAYQEAERQGVAASTLARYTTSASYSYKESLATLQKEYEFRDGLLKKTQEELDQITQVIDAKKVETKTIKENTNAVKANAKAKEKLLLHAGYLGDADNTLPSFPLGHVYPSVNGSTLGGLTGLYTIENNPDLIKSTNGFLHNEWQGARISSIDPSYYKLLDMRDNALADKFKTFVDDLHANIYGYGKDWSTGEEATVTIVKTVKELYAQLEEIVDNVNMDFKSFAKFIANAQAIVDGHDFKYEKLPAIDEGITKSGVGFSLQGVSKEIFNADSFATQLLKKLGYEGVDVSGTKYSGTYSGGSVLFGKIKPESIVARDEKWSDVMARYGYKATKDDLALEEKRYKLDLERAKVYNKLAQSSQDVAQETKSTSDMLNDIADSADKARKDAEAAANALADARKGKGVGQAYSGTVYHGSKTPLNNITLDPNKGTGWRNLGQGMYYTPELAMAADYGNNIVQTTVDLKNVFMLVKDSITSIDDLYAAIGREVPKSADWDTVTSDLGTYLTSMSNIINFSKRMQEMGYDGIFSRGYGFGDDFSEQLVVYDEKYWKNLTTTPFEEIQKEYDTSDDVKAIEDVEKAQDKLKDANEELAKSAEKAEKNIEEHADALKEQSNVEPSQPKIRDLSKQEHNTIFGDGYIDKILNSLGVDGKYSEQITDLVQKLAQLTALQVGDPTHTGIDDDLNATISELINALSHSTSVTVGINERMKEVNDLIGLISSAAGKDAAAKFLEGMTDQSEFKDRLSDYFNDILDVNSDWRLKSGKGAIVTQDDIAMVHLFNEQTEDTLDLVFRLKDGMLELAKGPKFGFTNTEPFDLESAKKLAEIQVRDLKANLGGRAYDGMSTLETSLGNIADPKTLEEFNNKLKIAKEEIKALKKEYAAGSGSLNDFSRAGTVMRNAEENIARMRDELKLLGDVDGVERATKALDKMAAASKKFNESTKEEAQKTAYQEYNEGFADYRASYSRAQSAKRALNIPSPRDFDAEKASQSDVFNKWQADIKNIGMLSDETAQKIEDMKSSLQDTKNLDGLDNWIKQFKELKSEVFYESKSKQTKTRVADIKSALQAQKQELEAMYRQLDFSLQLGDTAPNAEALRTSYDSVIAEIERCRKSVGDLSQEEIAAATAAGNALKEKLGAYKSAQDVYETARQAQEELTGDGAIKGYYQTLNSTIKQIARLDSKMNGLKLKDDGSGTWAPLIDSLEMQREELLSKVRDTVNEINTAFKGSFVVGEKVELPFSTMLNSLKDSNASGIIQSFFSDIRVQEALTEQSIDQFVINLQNQQNKTEEFAMSLVEKLKSVSQAAQTLTKLGASGFISTDSGWYQGGVDRLFAYEEYKSTLSKDPTTWSSEQIGTLQRLANEVDNYVTSLDKAVSKEAQYFANKKQYANIDTFSNYEQVVRNINATSDASQHAKRALEEYVGTFSNGQAIITGFTTSAEGISRIDYSFLDETTQQFHSFYTEMGQFSDTIYTVETSMKNLTAGTDAAMKSLASMSEVMVKLNQLKLDNPDLDINNAYNKLNEKMKELDAEQKRLGGSKDVGDQTKLKNLAAAASTSTKEIVKLIAAWGKTQELIASNDLKNLGAIDIDGEVQAQMLDRIRESAEGATVSNAKFNDKTKELTYTLTTADGVVKQMSASVDELTGTVTAGTGSVGKLKTWWQDLGSGIGGIGKEVGRYAVNLFQVMDLIRYIRTGFNTVLEIDTALTELRKVTDETNTTYKEFLQTMSKTGAVVGSTVKDLTTSASDWARLGYSIEEAGKLAENTMVLMNVSEFENVSEATDTLISAIQAFKTDGTDVGTFSMEIIDQFNTIGNSYAISTSDLADSLTRSSAALVAANNSLEESIALTTAANTTIQDPEAVGTALKTVSMRIRGVKTELEEAGEDTEGMITNTAKLQEKIMALTNIDGKGGINILTESGDFKSTYQILLDISRVWDKMSDTSQAALLETIAGKTRGSVVASIFQNGDILKSAYESASGASGSAQQELDKYLDSIQGRLDQLSNSVQTMWMNFMNSEVVKFFIDLANGVVKLTDGLGLANVAVAAFFAKTALNADSFGQFLKFDDAAEGVDKFSFSLKGAAKNAKGMGIGAKAAAVGTQLLNSALSMGISLLAGWLIGEIINSITEAANRMKELTESAIKSAEETKDAQKSLSDYKEEIDSLRKTLDSNTSSELEAYNARQRLIEIQNELIDKFGAEAKGINLVTGEIQKQKDALDELSRKQATAWLNENVEAYDDAKETMSEKHRDTKGLMLFGQQSSYGKRLGTLVDVDQDIQDKYREGLRALIEDKHGAKIDQFTNNAFDQDFLSFEGKTVEEISAMLDDIAQFMFDFENQNEVDLTAARTRVQEYKKKYVDEDYINSRTLYNEGRQQEAISKYASEYGDILDAQEEFYNANTDEERLKALQKMHEKIKEAQDSRKNDEHMDEWFGDLSKEFADQEFELKLKLNEDGLKTDLENIINESGEKGLSALDNNQIKNMIDLGLNKEGATDESGAYTDEQIKGLVALQAMADQAGISLESLIGLMVQYKLIAGQPVETDDSETIIKSVTTYSDLVEQVTNYNDALTQTSEIVSDNTEVTQEYKDALLALGISSEDLNECFDENNDLVVKDAKALNNLVKSAKKNTAQNIRLAKSQAKLEYYELYKQIKNLTNGQKVNDSATLSQINSLYAQMTAVQKTIAKYSLLEATLLGSANAYEKLAEAQEMDEAADYGSRAEELVNVLAEAFNTSQLGTEAAQVAIAGLVPDEVFAEAEALDDKMQKIYEYFTEGKVSKLFTIEFDDDGAITGVEMTKENVEKFTQSLIDADKVFHGTWDEFTLDDSIKTLDQFAEALGVTKEVALAYLTELEKYDISWLGGDGSTLLDYLMPTSDEIDEFGRKMNEAFSQGSIDLTVRPKVSYKDMQEAGWDVEDGSYSTVNTVTYTASDFGLAKKGSKDDYAINVTPILPDGTVIQGGYDGLSDYIMGELDSGKSISDLPIFLGMYKTIEEAEQMAEELHEAQEVYFDMLDSYSLDSEIYRTTQELAELEYQLATGAITAEEYKKAMYGDNGLAAKEAELGQRAREDTSAYYEKTEQLAKYQNQLSSLQKQLQTGVDDDGNLVDKEKVQKEIDSITEKITGLVTSINALGGEPTQIVLELAKENIESEIKALEEQDITISGKVTFDNESGQWVVNPGEEGNAAAQKYADLKNESDTISSLLSGSMPTVETYLGNIESILTSIKTILAGGDTDNSGGDVGADDGNSGEEGSGAPTDGTGNPTAATSETQGGSGDVGQAYQDPAWSVNPTTELPGDTEVTAEEVEVTGDKVVADDLKPEPGPTPGPAQTPGATEAGGGVAGIYGQSYIAPEVTPAPTLAPEFDSGESTANANEYAQALNNVGEQSEQLQNVYSGDDPLGVHNANLSIKDFKQNLIKLGVQWEQLGLLDSPISSWFDGKKDIVINVPDLVASLQEKGWTNEQIKSYLESIPTSEFDKFEIVGLDKIDDAIEEINALEVEDKTSDVEVIGDKEAKQKLQDVDDASGDVTKTVTTEYVTTYKTIGGGTHVTVDGSHGGRYAVANGTAHAEGTAHKTGSWGAPKTETALVGELGPELLVRNGRWTTIGENGAEFTDIRKGDIIFNHKQTEELLSKGYVTGRGKAYADGTAYVPGINTFDDHHAALSDDYLNKKGDAADKLSGAADDISDAADEFREAFDWIEVRLEEINEDLSLKSAKLENAVGSNKQNAIIDDMIELNQKLYNNLTAGASKYYAYAQKLLAKVPAEYRAAAQDGSIAIEEFTGEVGEETLEAIQNYREWVQKGADATQQAEETLTEISNLAKQAIDNIASEYENKSSIPENKLEQLEAYNALIETDLGSESANVYKAIIKANNDNIKILKDQRNAMQKELNARVESGEIKKYSQAWYDAVNDIAAVDTEIINLTTDTENYQDAINELHWEHFDDLITRLNNVSEEAENLIDILSNKDVVDEAGTWTEEGITSLGLYAQQMEAAEVQAKKYKKEIDYLNKNWKKLGYTEQEYVEKLAELKEGQYDAIKAYHDTKDAIVDLNKERVDAIKKGIEKEIDAYEELIKKKKEALDADKDLHDFEKSVIEQKKDVTDIERQLAALIGDNSASARAQRARLEAELLEAQATLEETYYDRSINNQQEALDKELESFQEEKEAEIEGWEAYLENTELVVSDSLATIQANTDVVYQTLKQMGEEYSLSMTETLTSPWEEGEYAIQSFSEKFGISMSATVEELEKLSIEFKETMLEIEQAGTDAVNNVKKSVDTYTKAKYKETKKEEPKKAETKKEEAKAIKVNGKINAGNARIYDHAGDKTPEKQYFSKDPIYTVLKIDGNWVQVRHHTWSKGITGWFKKGDIKPYASGTTGVPYDQFAWIDELGEELVMRAGPNGRLEYLTKGTSVIPAEPTENLMKWGELDPSVMLERNKPTVGVSPSVINNTMEINVDAGVGTLIHINEFNGDDPAEVTRIVNKALEQHTKNLNNAIKKYTR